MPILPNPPQSSSDAVGYFHIDIRCSFSTGQISDGPNSGFRYVQSVSSQSQGVATHFWWTITQALDDSGSEFYQKQCGNYHRTNNPNGFISGSQFKSNVIHHESGSTPNSHYYQYMTEQDKQEVNLGTVAESYLANSSISAVDFVNGLTSLLNGKTTAITNATSVEPCGGVASKDNNCDFCGYVNYPPYTTCP